MFCCSCDNRGVMFSGCLSKCVPILWTQSLKNAFSEFISFWLKLPLQLKDELISICWTKLKVFVTSQHISNSLSLQSVCPLSHSSRSFFFKGMASGDHLEWCLSWTPLVMSGRGAQPGCVYLGWWVLDEAQPSSVGSVWPSARALHSLLLTVFAFPETWAYTHSRVLDKQRGEGRSFWSWHPLRRQHNEL